MFALASGSGNYVRMSPAYLRARSRPWNEPQRLHDSDFRVAGRDASEGSGHVAGPEPVLHRGRASRGLSMAP